MARLARIVLPGLPYHVTQRGNRRAADLLRGRRLCALSRPARATRRAGRGREVWAYCLMPNHVHLIVVPGDEDGLRRTFADAHRRYTGFINARNRWTGHLWQGRFGSVAMDEAHLVARRALCRAQPGAGPAVRAGRGLALVERPGPSRRRGRPARQRRAAA